METYKNEILQTIQARNKQAKKYGLFYVPCQGEKPCILIIERESKKTIEKHTFQSTKKALTEVKLLSNAIY